MEKLIITPKTKIFDLLEAFPQLEEVLINLAPQFKKLKSPVLRKTIAKITSISQAATIGGLNVEELVNTLRAEVGQSGIETNENKKTEYITSRPGWFHEDKIVNIIDIRDMLNAGEQPVHEVLSAIKRLKEDEILKIIAPFLPVPLLDKTLSMKYRHWVDKQSEEEFLIYFVK